MAAPDEPISNPYATSASEYLAAGWNPVPVPPKSKAPVPPGFTGYEGREVTERDVTFWIDPDVMDKGDHNVALRMPRNVVGIDVDAYEGKVGGATLADLEARLGPLLSTWRSTSRPEDDVSGILFFRVPEDKTWVDAGEHVETISWHHRYAVVWPSMHPDHDGQYLWVSPDGTLYAEPPAVADLPELPAAWVEHLSTARPRARSMTKECGAPVEPLSPERARPRIAGVTRQLAQVQPGARATKTYCLSRLAGGLLVRVPQEQRVGDLAPEAVSSVLIDASRSTGLRRAEAQRHVENGLRDGLASPVPDDDVPSSVLVVVEDGQVLTIEIDEPSAHERPLGDGDLIEIARGVHVSAEAESAFWTARPALTTIHDFARAQRLAPWAVLGGVLVHVVASVTPRVVLADVIVAQASLNQFLGLVGASSGGKGGAGTAAREVLGSRGGLPYDVVPLGTGAGITHAFAHREGRGKGTVIRDAESVVFEASEVDTLAGIVGMKGSGGTLLPELRKAWSGERLGFSNADLARRLPLNPHTYRLGLVVGIQPTRAGVLLDDADGGTPQRFLWMPVEDFGAPDIAPAKPEPIGWTSPEFPGGHVMEVCQEAREVIDGARLARLRGRGDALDGHALLCRLKVAAALSILDGRRDVEPDDWHLAGHVADVSAATRGAVVEALAAESKRANASRAKASGDFKDAETDRLWENAIKRVLTRLNNAADWTSRKYVLNGQAGDARKRMSDALDYLADTERVECRKVPGQGEAKVEFRLAQPTRK